MKQARKIITANWKNIVSANYIVHPDSLRRHIPYGTELDYFNGNCYISLVAFKYTHTRLNKIQIPFHTSFEEINLRIYIKKQTGTDQFQYGVAFPKLLFPKRALTLFARLVYKEDYSTLKMNYQQENNKDNFMLKYSVKNHTWHTIEILADTAHTVPLTGSRDEFFNKHFWGYSKVNDYISTEYELVRNNWGVHAIQDCDIQVDIESLFGREFDFMNRLKPESITVSNGSLVEIKTPGRIIRKH